ncbi:MAG: GNAT family N-acetyltransferase [Chloroflexota bacterium]|nr:GNAT family N-acetyltransferase [Chloroflexota bacterium]
MDAGPERRRFGICYGWWRGDAIPSLQQPAGLMIERLDGGQPIPAIDTLDPAEAGALRREGYRLYVARLGAEVVGYGWAATKTATIGELGVEMRLAPNDRYLWGFVTLSRWRGRGIYPALIQAMLAGEADADRCWIGHDVGNDASARGILKAGFAPVGEAFQGADDVLRYARSGDDERARDAGRLTRSGAYGLGRQAGVA